MNKLTPTQRFIKALADARIEENVRDAFKKLLGARQVAYPFNCDGLMADTLFEFKQDRNFHRHRQAQILAQITYYLHEFSVKGVWKGEAYSIPLRAVGANSGWAFVVSAESLRPYFEGDYDFSRAASAPDERLVADLASFSCTLFNMTTQDGVDAFVDVLPTVGTRIFKTITRENFTAVFQVWKSRFAPNYTAQLTSTEKLQLSQKQQAQLLANRAAQWAADMFLLDIREPQNSGNLNQTTGVIFFDQPGHEIVKLEVPVRDYLAFWSMYHRPPTPQELAAIIERKDQLVAMTTRRVDGEFFTPVHYATKAHEYIASILPDRYNGQGAHHSMYDDYNWYDPCCGTGNLTLDCPSGMKGGPFLSTLNAEDVATVKASGQNPQAHVFQCDFLNQGFDAELPDELLAKMKPGSKWVFILNPPFAAGTGGSSHTAEKPGLTSTLEGMRMRGENMEHACQNISAHFMYRIHRLITIYQLEAVVALFSPPTFIASPKYARFRSHWYQALGYKAGFCFNSKEFQGTRRQWPVLLTIWSTGAPQTECMVDVCDENKKIGMKLFAPSGERALNELAVRPVNRVIMPPLKAALSQCDTSVRLDRIAEGAIGYAAANSNTPSHEKLAFILSAPYGTGNGWSITRTNFLESMVSIAARKLIVERWQNHRDEYTAPDLTTDPGRQFALDLIIWGLFWSRFNQTSSMGNVEYKGVRYDIQNEFFWLTRAEMAALTGLPPATWTQAQRSQERFVATWLQTQEFSPDCARLLELGKELVVVSADQRRNAQKRFQLDRWDAGFFQIKNGLYGEDCFLTEPMQKVWDAFQVQSELVRARLRPMVYALGILPVEIIFEPVDETDPDCDSDAEADDEDVPE